jgi:hypothetical protein
MSGTLLPTATRASATVAYYGAGSGPASQNLNVSSISTVALLVSGGNVGLGGGEYISTIGNQLFFFNGSVLEPISAISSISSIEEWSVYPAISTLEMAGEDMVGANIIESGLVSSMMIDTDYLSAQQAFVSDLHAYNITAENFTALSTIQTFNYVSSVFVIAQDVQTSTLNGYTIGEFLSTPSTLITSTLIANTQVSTPVAFISSINGLSIASFTASDTSNWASFPALTSVNVASNAINNVTDVNGTQLFITADKNLDLTGDGSVSILAAGGLRGTVTITADPGALGQSLGGNVAIVANGGSLGPIQFGGSITLDANTSGIGDYGAATSKITLGAAGINSYAGAIPAVASLVGYNFIYGTLGVNVCAGLPALFPNIPGTTYLYGTSGVGLEAGIGSEVEVKNSDFATLAIKPRTSVLVNFGDLVISGRNNITQPDQYVQLSNVKRIDFEVGELAAINNLSTINGVSVDAYINTPPISSFNQLFTSSLLASTVATEILEVSTINTNGSGFINWDGGASIYETGPNTLFITAGTATNIDIQGTGITFNEAGSGGTMSFTNSVLTVGVISTNTLNATTEIGLASTILKGSLTGATLEVLESAIPTNYGQVEAQAYTMAATTTGSNGTLYYRDVEDRAGFINDAGSQFTLAYTQDSNISVSSLTVSSINGSAYPFFKGGQYYLNAVQNLVSPASDIIFTNSTPWTDTTAITWTGPSASFTVAQKGIYFLELNIFILSNGAVLSPTTNRAVRIDLTRSPTARFTQFITNTFTVGGQNYAIQTSGTVALEVGDIIDCQVGLAFTGGPAQINDATGIDYNTFFTWTLKTPLP